MAFLFRSAVLLLIGCMATACTSYTTRPIRDEDGHEVAGSIASLERVMLGGVAQWILVRGKDARRPILLKLHGGPGQAEIATAALNHLLEEDFVVVEWDQRGSGKSRESIVPEGDMRLSQLVEDTHELTELLLKRFGADKLIPRRAFAPPYPGSEARGKRSIYLKWLERFGAQWHSSAKFDRVGWMLSSVEYAWSEKLRYTGAAERSFELLLPDLLAVDMSVSVPEVAVPVYFAVGRYDRVAPVEVSEAYFAKLVAPSKKWVWFEQSAHFPQWEEVEKFHALLSQVVLQETR